MDINGSLRSLLAGSRPPLKYDSIAVAAFIVIFISRFIRHNLPAVALALSIPHDAAECAQSAYQEARALVTAPVLQTQ